MLFRETHRIQTKPAAYGWLAGLFVFLFGMVAANWGCARYPSPMDDVLVTPRTPSQAAETSVEIYTECGMGTGVLIDGQRVLTANHVVTCEDLLGSEPARVIVVRTRGKIARQARIDVSDAERDLARLTLSSPIEGVPPVHIRDAKPDEVLCAVTAIPERKFRCGIAQPYQVPRAHGDVLMKGANVWYGNSGSGVYAQDGSLVGITVRLVWCDPADGWLFVLTDMRVDTCAGRVSSILDSPVKP